jgi:hypothetical protein
MVIHVDKNNFHVRMLYAFMFGVEHLKRRCVEFLMENKSVLMNSPRWDALCKKLSTRSLKELMLLIGDVLTSGK